MNPDSMSLTPSPFGTASVSYSKDAAESCHLVALRSSAKKKKALDWFGTT